MRAEAIVYTSQTGHTRQYARLLGEALGLPVQPLEENGLPRGSAVIYLGWLRANRVKGYRRAAGRYCICAVCGVGSALMAGLVDFAAANGFAQLELQVRSDNARAIALYEKFGFRRLCTHPAFFRVDGTDVDFELMLLRLAGETAER